MILDPQLYALFLTAALLLTLAPGPDTMFVLGAGLGGGARGGLLASAGIMTGLLVHLSLALVGVSALIAASPLAFDVLRWAGAAYLIWIGVPLVVRAWADGASLPQRCRAREWLDGRPVTELARHSTGSRRRGRIRVRGTGAALDAGQAQARVARYWLRKSRTTRATVAVCSRWGACPAPSTVWRRAPGRRRVNSSA